MVRLSSFLNGLGLGAAAMYFLDPARGRYRQALVRDQCLRLWHDTECALEVGWRDLRNRSSGWMAEMQHLGDHGPVDDQTLHSRVRSRMGRAVTHPRAIEVAVDGGHVRLGGTILSHEVDGLLRCVQGVPGVQSVENQLNVQEHSEGISDLQGQGRPTNPLGMNPSTQLVLTSLAGYYFLPTLVRFTPLSALVGAAAFIAMSGEAKARQHQRLAGQRQAGGESQESSRRSTTSEGGISQTDTSRTSTWPMSEDSQPQGAQARPRSTRESNAQRELPASQSEAGSSMNP